MSRSTKTTFGVVAVALAAIAPNAPAQTADIHRASCVAVGANPAEPIGDRPGHAIQVNTFTCRLSGGPMEGGVMTGTNMFEWDGGKAVLLSGAGVARKPGSFGVYQITQGSLTMVMADGKPAGVTGAGKGVMKYGSGVAAPFSGKTYSYTARSISPTEFVIETIYD